MLAVIPARGGSKGVLGKNIRELMGKPLIAYTIEGALNSDIFEKIIVSTDSSEIAEIALQYGAEVPFLRPIDISGDFVASDEAVIHALDYYSGIGKEFDEVCKLQPTSPLRHGQHIREAYHMLLEKKADYIVSVCKCEHSPVWSAVLDEKCSLDNFIRDEVKSACRQNLPTYYRLNGAIYMGRTKKFHANRSFFGKNGYAYIMQPEDSIDIDSLLDFRVAELMLRQNNVDSGEGK